MLSLSIFTLVFYLQYVDFFFADLCCLSVSRTFGVDGPLNLLRFVTVENPLFQFVVSLVHFISQWSSVLRIVSFRYVTLE